MKQITTKQAMQHLAKVMKDDPEYAYGWHANIAMMCHDSILSNDYPIRNAHEVGNEAASRFMKICFDAETSQNMLLDRVIFDKEGK